MVALLKRYRYCIIFLGILLFGLTSVLVFGDNRDDSSSKLNYDDWVLDWVENFDKQEIDTLIWSKIPRGKYAWNDMMSDDDRCFDLRNGCLILRGILNDNKSNDTSKYLTGGIYTKYKKSFSPGRFEFRVKINGAQGAWPALWLRPFKQGKNYPWDGEIDVVEHLNFDPYIYQTVHSYYITKLKQFNPKHSKKAQINIDEFNIYGVEITEDAVTFYVNGEKTFIYPNKELSQNKDQYPFFQDWFILVDMQLGGNWVGAIDEEDLPVEMEIDWIKHYKRVRK